jgi:hypothetical protein
MSASPAKANVWMVGGGIASMAAAAFYHGLHDPKIGLRPGSCVQVVTAGARRGSGPGHAPRVGQSDGNETKTT